MDFLRSLFARLRVVHPLIGIALVVGWMALIWMLSSQSPTNLSKGSPFGGWISNLAHAPEFAGLALWLALAARRAGASVVPTARAAFWIVAFCLIYAVIDELHQSTVPGRDASVLDVLTDLCGAIAAVCVLRTIGDKRKFTRSILLGTAVCMVAAALATFVPRMAPEITWL